VLVGTGCETHARNVGIKNIPTLKKARPREQNGLCLLGILEVSWPSVILAYHSIVLIITSNGQDQFRNRSKKVLVIMRSLNPNSLLVLSLVGSTQSIVPTEYIDSNWWKDAILRLKRQELICSCADEDDERDDELPDGVETVTYSVTPKGRAFLNKIMETPLPINIWGYPKPVVDEDEDEADEDTEGSVPN
jgi:hypothetical protein